jgi:hypothetical protein
MRLDSIGKPITAPSDIFEKIDVDKMKVTAVAAPKAATSDDDSASQQGKEPRLGKILDLIEKAQEKKKEKQEHQKNKQRSVVIKAYQKFSSVVYNEPQLGQGVNIKV